MAGRALLIGSEFDDLAGVRNDVAAMRRILEGRGFSVDECLTPDATRDGILQAYARFTEQVEAGDAAVVFYSGHGGFVDAPSNDPDMPGLMDMQFILPLDYDDSTDDDFRGITSVELTDLHARLRAKTDNVVVILDCCHASHMSRQPGPRIKGWNVRPSYERVRAHLDRVFARGGLELWTPEGNPDIVRIVACAPSQPAFEYRGISGERIGVLTEALTTALAEAGTERVTWSAVMDRIRIHVTDLRFPQRPEIEGIGRRRIFETDEADQLASLPVTLVDDAGLARLDCAPLLGVQVGDRFAVMPPGAVEADAATMIGELTVTRLGPLSAEGRITFAGDRWELPLGARAYPTETTAPRITVRIPSDGRAAGELRSALDTTPLLQVAAPGDDDWEAEVRLGTDGTMTLHDRIGPLGSPAPASAGGVTRVVSDLKNLALAIALRRFPDRRVCVLDADIEIEWGIVVDERPQPLSDGDSLHAEDKFYIRVHNPSAAPVFVSFVDIGVTGTVSFLNTESPSGREIPPGKTWDYGAIDDLNGVWEGFRVWWPDDLDPVLARPETLLVFVTSAPQDLRALEQPGLARRRALTVRPGMSPLLDMIDQLAIGGSREIKTQAGSEVRYGVHSVTWELDPVPREGRFLVEAPLNPATLASGPRGSAPMTLAIRLDELIVHHNRTLLGGAGIRVDTLVATGSRGEGGIAYEAHTARFDRIRKDEALPIDRMLMFHGKAEDYVDIAVWVTRDSAGAAELAELLAGEFAGDEGRRALAGLGTAVLPDPTGGVLAAAVAAGAVAVRAAAKVLRRTGRGESIGLYRGARLESERFGVGRVPMVGRRPVQDFSIAFTIEEAG